MKCPKCGYHSFDHLDHCKKCAQELIDHKAQFNLRGFFFPGQTADQVVASAQADTAVTPTDHSGDTVDFGFDFLDEEESPADDFKAASDDFDLDTDLDEFNLDKPFGIDGESVPAGESYDRNENSQ